MGALETAQTMVVSRALEVLKAMQQLCMAPRGQQAPFCLPMMTVMMVPSVIIYKVIAYSFLISACDKGKQLDMVLEALQQAWHPKAAGEPQALSSPPTPHLCGATRAAMGTGCAGGLAHVFSRTCSDAIHPAARQAPGLLRWFRKADGSGRRPASSTPTIGRTA